MWRRIASTAPVTSRRCCAKQARDMSSASPAPRVPLLGQNGACPAPPRRSRRPCRRRLGRLSSGEGTKGPRLYDWAYLELADLDVAQYYSSLRATVDARPADPARPGDGAMAFFSTWCPKGTPPKILIEVEGRRWAIEDSFETAKTELGLDHNETRCWHGWHRHVSLVMLAFAMLMVIRHKADTLTSPQKRPPTKQPNPWSDGHSRRSVVLGVPSPNPRNF